MTTRTLVRNESIKTLRRPAFWVTAVAFAAMLGLSFIGDVVQRVRQGEALRTLPDAWAWIIGDLGPVAALFGAVVLILLVANEFAWRTARQNVIDGLSREQWFAGKLMLVPAVVLGFIALQLVTGGTVALVATLRTGAPDALIGGTDLAHIGGVLLAALGYASLAFLAAMLFRSAGAAIGVFFLYLVVVEPLIGAVSKWTGVPVAKFMPRSTFDVLGTRALWEGGSDAATVDPLLPVLLGWGWMLILISAAFIDFMRRDL